MSISIKSNIAAMNAQRRLGESTALLAQSFSRLSSGLRINRASDDAAGLSISSSLNADARVYGQAVRNGNDALSYLSISESALGELAGLLIRQRELATQASNGALTFTQRKALHTEASELTKEFNRIIATTEFNGVKVFQDPDSIFRAQLGYGVNGGISVATNSELARTIGDGTYGTETAGPARAELGVELVDVNGDGILDIIGLGNSGTPLRVAFGIGDGTFQTFNAVSSGTPSDFAVGDLDGDGRVDAVTTNHLNQTITIAFNGGSGTFATNISIATANAAPRAVIIGDFDNDSKNDMVVFGTNALEMFHGNGNGSFRSGVSTSISGGAVQDLQAGDFNNDGLLDVVTGANGNLTVYLGTGTGTFKAGLSLGTSAYGTVVDDFNDDGIDDFAAVGPSALNVFISNGDGTYRAAQNWGLGNGALDDGIDAADFNGDGIVDLAAIDSGDNTFNIYFGNGNGTFKARISTAATSPVTIAAGDLNRDGAIDIALGTTPTSSSIFIADTAQTTTALPFSLRTRAKALEAMSVIDQALGRVNSERALIGALQSRIGSALQSVSTARENYITAAAQISDADVAEETARLVKARILQQAGAAVLAQANQLPALALQLLK